MLECLSIKNFQAHKKIDIEFSPHITTIIGPSDVGKSAIIRALRWVCRNEPSGEAFIKKGTNKTEVLLSFEKGDITRTRGSSSNSYSYNDDNFNAFGNDVPENIAKALNISDINFQQQHDSPFWFCETAGEVSRQLNKIINLEVIDSTLANLASIVRKTSTELQVIDDRIKNILKEKDETIFIKKAAKELEAIEEQDKKFQEKQSSIESLKQLCERGTKYTTTKETCLKLKSQGDSIIKLGDEYFNKDKKCSMLANLVEQAIKYQKIANNRPPSIKKLQEMYNNYNNINIKMATLEALVEKAIDSVKSSKESKERVKTLKQQLKKEIGSECPLCGQLIKNQ